MTAYESQVALADLFAPLRRRRKFLAIGIALSWAALLLIALALPAAYRSEATLMFPRLAHLPEPDEPSWASPFGTRLVERPSAQPRSSSLPSPTPGVPLPLFRKLERSLAAHGVSLSPIAATDPARLDRSDGIAGVQLHQTAASESEAIAAVGAIAQLVRESLIVESAREELERLETESLMESRRAVREKVRLAVVNKSLDMLAADLERLGRRPTAGASTVQALIDLHEGGQVFLPPHVQIGGIRAQQAANLHVIRLAGDSQRLHELKAAFLRRVNAALAADASRAPRDVVDMPQLVRRTLGPFQAEHNEEAAVHLALEIDGWIDDMVALRANASLAQPPAAARLSRTPVFAAAALFAVVALIAAAVLLDLWLPPLGASRPVQVTRSSQPFV